MGQSGPEFIIHLFEVSHSVAQMARAGEIDCPVGGAALTLSKCKPSKRQGAGCNNHVILGTMKNNCSSFIWELWKL